MKLSNKTSKRMRPACAALLLAALLLTIGMTAAAAVELARFDATAQTDETIMVEWETGSELETIGFRLYRTQAPTAGDLGVPIYTAVAGNGPTGQVYTFFDANVQPGILYYYWLEDVDTGNTVTRHGPASAGIGLSATPTNTVQPGNTPVPGAQPTATRQFTNTPQPGASPLPGSPGGTGPRSPIAIPTRLGPAVVTTPTRVAGALLARSSLAAPTAVLTAPPVTLPSPPAATATATAKVIARTLATAAPTVTPIMRDATPAVFEAAPTSTEVATAVAGRTVGPAMVVAGLAIGVSGLIAVVVLRVLRSRQ